MTSHEENLEREFPLAPRMSWTAWLLTVGVAVAAIGYSIFLRDYVVAGSVAVVLVTALAGYRMGLTRMGASLAAFAAAIMFAPQLGITYESHFTQWFGTTGLLNRIIAVGAIGIGISLLATIVLSVVTTRILRSRPRLARMNCWLGFGTGAAQGALAVLLFLGGLLVAEPMQSRMAGQDAQTPEARPVVSQQVTATLLAVTDRTHASRLGPVIEEYNPFERFEPLKKFEQIQKSVQVLSDPQKINDLLHHPSIHQLQDRPEIKQAVGSLMDDSQIREVLQSGRAMNRETAIQLLSHPAVLELLEQPGFLEEAGKVIQQTTTELNIQI